MGRYLGGGGIVGDIPSNEGLSGSLIMNVYLIIDLSQSDVFI